MHQDHPFAHRGRHLSDSHFEHGQAFFLVAEHICLDVVFPEHRFRRIDGQLQARLAGFQLQRAPGEFIRHARGLFHPVTVAV